jgi:hypothetical protein
MEVLNFYKVGGVIPEDALYIGRENRSKGLLGSKFANPFPINEQQNRDEVIRKYTRWLWGELKEGRVSLDELVAMKGKRLVCFCAPQKCHGDVLLKAIAWAEEELKQKDVAGIQTQRPKR